MRPIKGKCRGSSSACALLDGTNEARLRLACALQGQSAAIARAMASICNAEWANCGGQSGHEGLLLKLSDHVPRQLQLGDGVAVHLVRAVGQAQGA